jgi:hypothetical protein
LNFNKCTPILHVSQDISPATQTAHTAALAARRWHADLEENRMRVEAATSRVKLMCSPIATQGEMEISSFKPASPLRYSQRGQFQASSQPYIHLTLPQHITPLVPTYAHQMRLVGSQSVCIFSAIRELQCQGGVALT